MSDDTPALVPNAESDPFLRRLFRCRTQAEKDRLAEGLNVAYRVHWAAHEILLLDKQMIRMTLDGIKRGWPRQRMLRAFKRDAERIILLANLIIERAAQGMSASGQDREAGLEAKPASPVGEADAPKEQS